jgi:methylthioribose-1-phosphate isomerase
VSRMKTIRWKQNRIVIIDQTRLPGELKYLSLRNLKALWGAIFSLKVRGAPALGAGKGLPR